MHFPDILFLMETKNTKDVVVDYQGWLGYNNIFTVEPIGLSGGLALYWKSCYKFEILHVDKNVIDVRVEFFCYFYVGASSSRNEAFGLGKANENWCATESKLVYGW